MVHNGFNVEDARFFTDGCPLGFDNIGSFVEIQIFQKNDPIKDIEFELQENSQANPAKILKNPFTVTVRLPKNKKYRLNY